MKRFWLLTSYLLLPPAAAVWGPPLYREWVYPRRFAAVREGAIYRGGDPSAANIRRLKVDYGIRTVVSLTDDDQDPDRAAAAGEIQDLGLRRLRFPMPGDGVCEWSKWEAAADAAADEKNWPVFFHCAAGKQRSNAVLATYRLRHCGWTLQQTLDELTTAHGLDPIEEHRLYEHIQGYARRLTESRNAEVRSKKSEVKSTPQRATSSSRAKNVLGS